MVRTFLATRRSRIQRWALLTGVLAGAVAVAPMPASAAFPGSNGRVFFSGYETGSGVSDVYSIRPDGGGLTNLTDAPGGPGSGADPFVSGDGSRVVFSTGLNATSEIWIMNADGSSPQRLTTNSSRDEQPAISPDGTRIAWVAAHDQALNDNDIWTMSADGSGAALLVDGPGADVAPEFSPDGLNVVLASQVSGDFDIAYAPSTGGPHPPTPLNDAMPADEVSPSVRPDGTRVAFARGSPADIHDAFFNGTDELPIATDPAADERSPAYSPDGTQIAYDVGPALIVAAAGGANPQVLDTGPVQNPGDPNWAAGGDIEPPETTITKAPKRRTSKRTAGFRFRSSEPRSRFECKLDTARFKPCASPRAYRSLKRGRHKFRVRAIDRSGNVDPAPAKAKFRITP